MSCCLRYGGRLWSDIYLWKHNTAPLRLHLFTLVNYFSVTSRVFNYGWMLNTAECGVGSALPNRRRAAVSIRPDGRILEIFVYNKLTTFLKVRRNQSENRKSTSRRWRRITRSTRRVRTPNARRLKECATHSKTNALTSSWHHPLPAAASLLFFWCTRINWFYRAGRKPRHNVQPKKGFAENSS